VPAKILVVLVVAAAADIEKAEHDTLLHLLVLQLLTVLKMWRGVAGLVLD